MNIKLIAIANICTIEGTVGFRLLDIDTKQTKNVPLESIKIAMLSGKATIENLKIENTTIIGSNGSIDRLPKVINGQLIGKSPLIILNQLDDIGYTVSDFKGTISKVNTEDTINYAKTNGISNGKLVNKGNKRFMSSITGEYDQSEPKKKSIRQEIKEYKAKSAMLGLQVLKFKIIDGEASLDKLPKDLLRCIIPNLVSKIYSRTFCECKKLKEVLMANGVTEIEREAFSGCNSLQNINISNRVTEIGEKAFYGCSSLQTINIPNSVTKIGAGIFYDCSSIQNVTIPNSVTEIGTWAFKKCSSLQNITLPNSITKIKAGAFSDCSSLQGITIPNSVTTIEHAAFSYCTSLQNVTLPNSVVTIEDSAFCACSSLQSITIPNSITEIGSRLFAGCTSLQSITVPNSVTKIKKSAFDRCTSLIEIKAPKRFAEELKNCNCGVELY